MRHTLAVPLALLAAVMFGGCVPARGSPAMRCWTVATHEEQPELERDALALTQKFDGFASQHHLTARGAFNEGERDYFTEDKMSRVGLTYGMGPRGTVVTIFSKWMPRSLILQTDLFLKAEIAPSWAVRTCEEVGMPAPVEYPSAF